MSIFSFPTMFSTRLDNLLPFSSNLKLSSANSFSLEEPKICCLVMSKVGVNDFICLQNSRKHCGETKKKSATVRSKHFLLEVGVNDFICFQNSRKHCGETKQESATVPSIFFFNPFPHNDTSGNKPLKTLGNGKIARNEQFFFPFPSVFYLLG